MVDQKQGASTGTKPLVEVVFGAAFAAPQFNVTDYGMVFLEFRDTFPKLSGVTMPTIVDPKHIVVNVPLLPRTLFESEDSHLVLQLQPDRLLLNWRRLDEQTRYPGFDSLCPTFQDAWGRFTYLFERQNRGPVVLQSLSVTYTNNLSRAFLEQVPGTCFRWEHTSWRRKLPEPKARVVQYAFEFSDNVRVRATAQPAVETMTQREVLSLQLDATSLASQNDMDAWFNAAHRRLHETLEDMVTEAALKLWRAQE